MNNLEIAAGVVTNDLQSLKKSQKSYGDSWKHRGGTGAFMMLARKWDRIENQVKEFSYDILKAGMLDNTYDGIMDDIGDLRRYLILVESEIVRLRMESSSSEPLSEGYVNQD